MFNFRNSEDHKYWLFKDLLNYEFTKVENRIRRNNLDINHSDYLDDCSQNLLHIAVRMGNYEVVKKLLGFGANMFHKNIFNENVLDIAIQKNDTKMVQLLVGHDSKKLVDENTELQKRNMELENENRGVKRIREDLRLYQIDNKRLNCENSKLKRDNATLETTIKNLRKNF